MDILLSLSDELVRLVLQDWLKLRDVVRLTSSYKGHVSHPNFNRLLTSCSYNFAIKTYLPRRIGYYIEWLAAHSVDVTCLVVPFTPPTHQTHYVNYFYTNGSQLKELRIIHSAKRFKQEDNIWSDHFCSCPNLIRLTLDHQIFCFGLLLKMINMSCPRLEYLCLISTHLNGNMPDAPEWRLSALKTLRLEHCTIDPDQIEFLTQVAPNVEHLHLEFCTIDSAPDFLWPGLKRLHLRHCAIDHGVWGVLTSLRVLHLQGSSKYVNRTLMRTVAANCTNLTELTIRCPHLTDADVCCVTERCARLTALHMIQSLITDIALLSVATYNMRLTDLSLEHCSLVGEEGLLAVAHNCKSLETISYISPGLTAVLNHDTIKEAFRQNGVSVLLS